MGHPTPVVGGCALARVARAAQHRRVGDVERRTAGGERHDVVDGQVACSVGGAAVARAPVAVLATPGAKHPGAEPLPGPRAVEGVVAAAVGLPGVLGAATTSAAGDDTADRAQLHPQIVGRAGGVVYSPAVLRLRGHGRPCRVCAASERRAALGSVPGGPRPRPAASRQARSVDGGPKAQALVGSERRCVDGRLTDTRSRRTRP